VATNHNFRVKNGLEVAGTEIVNSSGVIQLASTLTSSTQSAGTNNTTLATTAFVTAAVAAIGDGHIDWTGSSAGTIHSSNYTNTTYSVGDGGLTTNDFTNADHSKLNAIEASATADQTNAEIRAAVEAATDSNVFTDADHTKLNAVEASADVTDTTNVVAALTAGTNVTIAANGTIASTDTNTTYSVGDGGLTTNDFTDADHTKLNAIEASATADQTNTEIRTAVEAATDSNVFTDADHTKLNAVEASADVTDTANVVAALTAGTNVTISAGGTIASTDTNTTYSVGDGGLTTNDFTNADHSKLNAIEASADVTDTANVVAALSAGTGVAISGGGAISVTAVALTTVQTASSQSAHLALTAEEGDIVVRSDENKTYCHNGGSAGNMNDYTLLATPTDAVLSVNGNTGAVSAAQIAAAVEAASNSNTFTDADHSKLNAIEASATADQTNAEIRTAVEAASDSNVFTDADHTKLNAIEASATADQTNAEIRAAIEAATDSNAFTDADHSKLNAIEASADVTDTTNVVAALTAGTNVTIAANGTIASTDTNTTYSVGDGELSQNNFTNADHSKLNAIEASATADQTDAEIRAAVEAATDSNVFTNADHTKLNAIEASADVTDTANVTAAGALMDSELTSIASIKALNQALATSNSPTFAALTITGAITSAAKNVGTQTITATAPSSASGFPNGHVWYVV
jgi:hypothetical protein